MRIGALVLAAGRSSRMGQPKVLLPWRGRPLLEHVLAVLAEAGAEPVLVVTGPDTPPLPALGGAELVHHPGAREGMGSSLAAGVRALGGRADAVLICLGDQPGIAAGTVAALVAALAPPALAAAPLYRGGVRGHPVLFAAALFAELGALQGDRGARAVLEGHPAALVAIPAPAPADVDTPGDYAALAGSGGAPCRSPRSSSSPSRPAGSSSS